MAVEMVLTVTDRQGKPLHRISVVSEYTDLSSQRVAGYAILNRDYPNQYIFANYYGDSKKPLTPKLKLPSEFKGVSKPRRPERVRMSA